MRWSIIRLIWFRELRDQLRDRRTIFMIAVLPILLYPILGVGVLQFALGFLQKQSVIGIYGSDNLPKPDLASTDVSPVMVAAWLTLTPAGPAASGSLAAPLAGTAALAEADQLVLGKDYPPLLDSAGGKPRFALSCFDSPEDTQALQVKLLDVKDPATDPATLPLPEVDLALLETKQVDVLLIVPADFDAQLREGHPTLSLLSRENDDRSRLVSRRVTAVLNRWKKRLKEIRLLRRGLPVNYDEAFEIKDSEDARSPGKQAAQGLMELMVRIFPFLLVMWSLAGALYPAVDLCAGEKERGTMETLLISPASRKEIVWGKFLTIWVFSAATALLNLASMAGTTWQFSNQLPHEALNPAALLWCVVLVLPLSAFFSALCLSIGAYARSSKEGQYYLMPLFLLTMPLIFLTLSPSVELNAFYSLVPVTGVALLLQRLMIASTLDQVPWLYFIPVLAPIVLYSWLAMRWAIEQFQREEVLFREAERLDIALWFRHLFRDKETTPSAGEALFCFGLILALRWLAFGFGERLTLPVRIGIGYLAFVAAPPLLMALMLTTRPRQGLALRLPTLKASLAALLLAVLLLPALSGITVFILEQFPELKQTLAERNPLTEELQSLGRGESTETPAWQYGIVLALLPAVCEELAFRGFILGGLRRRFRAWPAILLSSFFFALYHMNVFQLLPTFLLGVVLGMLALRTRSVLPGMVFHLMHNGLVVAALVWLEAWLRRLGYQDEDLSWMKNVWIAAAVVGTLAAAAILWRLSAFGSPFHEEPVPCTPEEDSTFTEQPAIANRG